MTINTRIYKLAKSAINDPEKAPKSIKRILMLLGKDLEVMYNEGINVAPPTGEYKVYIEDMHLLTKKIDGTCGKNFLPWTTKYIPLSPWRDAVERYSLPLLDFKVVYSPNKSATELIYDIGIVDFIKQVRDLQSTWVGEFWFRGKFKFIFRMVKV